MQFFTLGSSKIEVSKTHFFDIVTTQNDHATYVWCVLGRVHVFSTLFRFWVRGGGGVPKGLVHKLLLQIFTLVSSKIEVVESYFCDTVIT